MLPTISPDSIIGLFFPWHNAHLIEQMAGEVAREGREGLWQRVCYRTSSMSVAEIRGYVNAQSAGFVERALEQMFEQRGLKNPTLRGRVMDAAMSQLVGMVVHDVLCEASSDNTRKMAA